LVESGRLSVPESAGIITFLLSDGRLSHKPVIKDSLSLATLFDQFFEAIPDGNLEKTTLDGMKIHTRHLKRLIGDKFSAQRLSTEDLQAYVGKRSKEKTTKGTVGASTINKELVNFRTVWGPNTCTTQEHC